MGFHLFRTPPFSSEDEQDGDDLIQACASPDLLLVQSSKGNKCSFGKNTVRSDSDWTEGSETEDSNISPKPTGELWSLKILLEILFRTAVPNGGHQALGGGAGKVLRERAGLAPKPLLPKEDVLGLATN